MFQRLADRLLFNPKTGKEYEYITNNMKDTSVYSTNSIASLAPTCRDNEVFGLRNKLIEVPDQDNIIF